MKRTVVALGLLGLTVGQTMAQSAGNSAANSGANAQESVLYCVEERANGYIWLDKPTSKTFDTSKFVMKLTDLKMETVDGDTKNDWLCTKPTDVADFVSCFGDLGDRIEYSSSTRRFVRLYHSWVMMSGQGPVAFSIGTCSAF